MFPYATFVVLPRPAVKVTTNGALDQTIIGFVIHAPGETVITSKANNEKHVVTDYLTDPLYL